MVWHIFARLTRLIAQQHVAPSAPWGRRIPAQGNTLGIRHATPVRSEGTPHTNASPPDTRRHAASLQDAAKASFQGLHPRLVCGRPVGAGALSVGATEMRCRRSWKSHGIMSAGGCKGQMGQTIFLSLQVNSSVQTCRIRMPAVRRGSLPRLRPRDWHP
jgi:hypothetical protein